MRIWHLSTDSESGSWWIFKFFNKKEIDAKRLTLKTHLNLKKSFHPKFFANVRRYVVLTRYIKHFLLICLRYQQTYTVLSLFTLRSSLTFINLMYKSSELINYAIYSTGFLMIFFYLYKLFRKPVFCTFMKDSSSPNSYRRHWDLSFISSMQLSHSFCFLFNLD